MSLKQVIYSRIRLDEQEKVLEIKAHDANVTEHAVSRFIPATQKRLEYAGAKNIVLSRKNHMVTLIGSFDKFTEKHTMVIVS